jgi:hypothetical protein
MNALGLSSCEQDDPRHAAGGELLIDDFQRDFTLPMSDTPEEQIEQSTRSFLSFPRGFWDDLSRTEQAL